MLPLSEWWLWGHGGHLKRCLAKKRNFLHNSPLPYKERGKKCMPRFDFHCCACSHIFEENISFGSKEYPLCPECGSRTDKQFHAPAIHFKGDGFYKTDNTTKPPKKQKEEKKAKDTQKSDDKTPKKIEDSSQKKPPNADKKEV
jgi:putative FmdB family regulatory protein